jgi:hypothetical protein
MSSVNQSAAGSQDKDECTAGMNKPFMFDFLITVLFQHISWLPDMLDQ